NFLPATVGDGKLDMPFTSLPIPPAVAAAKKPGDLVIVGIRPEAFEDAALVEEAHRAGGTTFTANVDVTEWLGNEKYAYLPFEPHPEVQAALNELDRELDGEAMRTQLVVSLDGSSKIKQGDDAHLWFNPASVHVFDAASGENLTRDEAKAAEIARESEDDRKRELERAKRLEPASA
ncbi:MAG: ABC transporter, partial [Actinobacteria bacterium]|nr:ABC transporter [Actinomycetota bacterium]